MYAQRIRNNFIIQLSHFSNVPGNFPHNEMRFCINIPNLLEETELFFSGISKFEVFSFTRIQGNGQGLKRNILLMKVITIKKNMEHVIKDTCCFLRYRLPGS